MCGIIGIFHYGEQDRPVDRALLERMTRALAHRGPDGEGILLEGPVGFGHRRLAIVDLSPTGHQPMVSGDGALWVTYNGEFYNHASFRAELARARPFRGTSDTETLLRLFERRGPRCFEEIAGIFGVAFWDARRRVLTLARDPLGVKQLYYHDDGARIVFASEIKALLVCPDVRREIDEEGINQYLHFHTPLFDRTSFRGIKQLRPGEYIEVGASGLSRKAYFHIDDFTHAGVAREEEVNRLRERLQQIVSDQLMADVPVGAFFSGGIDSSAVAAFAVRSGSRPPCFGVHFADQGVIDERRYQEDAARALGLDLHLITLDGSTFADDLMKSMYHQDEPVIGPAMLPMFHISRLAARHVKVCMGGQGGDEVFGGYARYALATPLRVAGLWFAGRGEVEESHGATPAAVGGNLLRQLTDPRVLRRLVKGAAHLGDWRARYFETFAKVPEPSWRAVFAAPELVSRDACRALFYDEMDRSPAEDPVDKLLLWDQRGYLPGLFHQDDRMSMAHSLESRVPLADPRLVRFAARLDPSLKIRSGSTKWILRRAVADVLPASILNRRKVGFDTPAEAWMRGKQAGFVRDLLLSSRARSRGIWDVRGVEALLDHPGSPLWFDIVWKVLAIEAWAQIFLDAPPARAAAEEAPAIEVGGPAAPRPAPLVLVAPREAPAAAGRPAQSAVTAVRDAVQEVRELGPAGTAFRVRWELALRTGAVTLAEHRPEPLPSPDGSPAALTRLLPFGDGRAVAAAARGRIPEASLRALRRAAREAARGRILCFSRWIGDYGDPIDWHRNPVNGRRWDADRHWSRALRSERRVGDVKLTWEVGRFPQAYPLARAAAFFPEDRPALSDALASQIEAFLAQNPFARGVHWASGQEIAFRSMAWLFGFSLFSAEPRMASALGAITRGLHDAAAQIEAHLDYARKAVYNNHLLSEAFGLLLTGTVLPLAPESPRWRELGAAIIEEQAEVQVYPDGGYIQQSHTYHRVAMLTYLWAWGIRQREGKVAPRAWTSAMERSLDFLYAQQSAADGRLPNFGHNDGAHPSLLSTCDYTDFRPLLQALSVVTRGERLYEPGPWDECAAWFAGPAALDAKLRPRERVSVSFAATGYHALRGRDPSSFGVLRCGTLKHRFSQIDMMSLDVFWRGQNVLVDPGSYLYNGPARWHAYFAGTSGHNTVQVDGRDQMLHHRRFKNLYPVQADLLFFDDLGGYGIVEGEHDGYTRHPGGCVHRRAVLFVKDDLWVVVDRVAGEGEHRVRLQWLGGDYPHRHDAPGGVLTLETPEGPFCVAVVDPSGAPAEGDVVRGGQEPPRGWLSRYYGEKIPVPSLVVERSGALPITLVSVLSAGPAEVVAAGGRLSVSCGALRVGFRIDDGRFRDVRVEREALDPSAGDRLS
jgi:asparagine synthase (glutamine-hydrolysing)